MWLGFGDCPLIACTSGTVAVQCPPSVVVDGDDCSVFAAAAVWIKTRLSESVHRYQDHKLGNQAGGVSW